jgi:acyl carrier protein
MPGRAEIEETIQSFLQRVGKEKDLTPDMPLFAEGLGLDSLETAELSALLEDTHGTDPFQEEEMPQTVGEIFAFYEGAAA